MAKDSENYVKGARNEDIDNPAVTPKSKGVERLANGARSTTTVSGDLMDRYKQQYSKNPPVLEEDPLGPLY